MTSDSSFVAQPLTREQLFRRVVEILLAQENKPLSIAVFGSWARGDHRPDSDLDLLVEYTAIGLFEITGHWLALQEQLGMEVDLLTPGSCKRIRKSVDRDKVPIYP